MELCISEHQVKWPEIEHRRKGRIRYEVKIREPNGAKKSRFYNVKDAGEARRCYKGSGFIMWVNKVSEERRFNVGSGFTLEGLPPEQFLAKIKAERRATAESGSFFRLGGQLLKELKQEQGQNTIRGYDEQQGQRQREGNANSTGTGKAKRAGKWQQPAIEGSGY